MQIIPLFPKEIATFTLPSHLSIVCNYFNELKMETDKFPDDRELERDQNFLHYGLHSEDTYVMDNDECKDISKFVLDSVDEYNKKVIGYQTDGWQFSQSWVSWKYPGQEHIRHTHPNSLISAVLFYGGTEKETSPICFHEDPYFNGVNSIMQDAFKNDEYNKNIVSFRFTPGTLLIFPSHLAHSVPPNTTRIVRKSVSMNIVPKGRFGHKGSLTELLFNRLV